MEKLISDRKKLLKALSVALTEGSLAKDKEQLQKIVDEIALDKKGHFVSLSQDIDAKISYAPTPNFKFNNAQRKRTNLGRYIRRQLKVTIEEFSDAALYELGMVVAKNTRTVHELDDQISLLKGEDIYLYYKNEAPNRTHSCMTGTNASKTKLYTINPNISLVVTKRHTRALLWDCDDGTKVLDRAYPSGSKDVHLLRDWAISHGYFVRSNADQFMGGLQTVPLNDGSSRKVTVKHENVFPFMDTFAYGFMEKGANSVILSNDSKFGNKLFQDQHGACADTVTCSKCLHRYIGASNTFNGMEYCKKCYDSMFYRCKFCGETEDISLKSKCSGYCKKCFDKLEKCDHCNSVCEMTFEKDGNKFCKNCLQKLYVLCKSCKCNQKVDNMIEVKPEHYFSYILRHVCKDCNEVETTCFRCNTVFQKQNGMLFSKKWFCGEDCFSKYDNFCCEEHSSYICEKCRNPFLDEFDPRVVVNNINYCEDCHKNL
jgi:hypothetical protein